VHRHLQVVTPYASSYAGAADSRSYSGAADSCAADPGSSHAGAAHSGTSNARTFDAGAAHPGTASTCPDAAAVHDGITDHAQ
jgi:hypothetical protein